MCFDFPHHKSLAWCVCNFLVFQIFTFSITPTHGHIATLTSIVGLGRLTATMRIGFGNFEN